MRYSNTYISFLLIIIFQFAGLSQTENELKQMIAVESRHAEHLLEARESDPHMENYDLKYLRLEWEVDPAVRYISGTVTSYFVPYIAIDNIYFELSKDLVVDSVSYQGSNLSYTHNSSDQLIIDFPATVNSGILDSVSVTYHGVPPVANDGFGSFEAKKVCSNSVGALWTLSEPYGAKDWWPCKQTLNDKIDSIDVFVKVPQGNKVGSNGLLKEIIPDGTKNIYHWQHKHPIPAYLIAIAVSDYTAYSDFVPLAGGDSLEILNYVYPCSASSAPAQTPQLIPVMQLFIDLFGDYPFTDEKYGHAQFGWSGGMEHTTMTFIYNFSHYLMSHELAHQWFGDQITCQSWRDIWLNEGFATYLEGMTYEHHLSTTNTWSNWLQTRINAVTYQTWGSVWVDDTTSVSRIFNGRLSYSKGALLLHMLRWKMGDSDFFAAINNYLQDPDLAYGYATTTDLKNHLEAQSGLDLTEFFDDWFYGQGWPTYDVAWHQNTNKDVVVTINQTTSHPSVPFFEMPVPIQFYNDTDTVLLVFDHTHSGQVFTSSIPFVATGATFDPDKWLLAKHSIALPVELSAFNVNKTGNVIELSWTTQSEQNTAYFEIQRTDDVSSFFTIKNVEASHNSTEEKSYSFEDVSYPLDASILYYRLKIFNTDGSFEYSPIKSVVNSNKESDLSFKIIPNPNKGFFELILKNHKDDYTIYIYDNQGKLTVETLHATSLLSGNKNIFSMSIDNLPDGTYYIKIKNDKGFAIKKMTVIR